jgi:hypothetical protein
MKVIVLLLSLFIEKICSNLIHVKLLDYYALINIGGNDVKAKIDLTSPISVLTYDRVDTTVDTTRVTNKTINGMNVTFDRLIIDDELHIDDFGYLKGDAMTLGLGYTNRYGNNFSLMNYLRYINATTKRQFRVSKDRILFGDFAKYVNSTTIKAMSGDDLSDKYKDGWLCDLSYILFADGDNKTALELDARVIFDYKDNYLRIPKKYKYILLDTFLLSHNSCAESQADDNTTKVTCPNNVDLNNYYVVLTDTAFKVNGLQNNLNTTHFELNVRFTDEEKVWVLGRPFLAGRTITYDADNKEVTFEDGDMMSFEGKKWYTDLIEKAHKNMFSLVVAGVICFLFLIIVIICIIRSCRRKRLEEHGPLINERYQ